MAELIREPVTILDHEPNLMQEEDDFFVGGFSKCSVVTKSFVAPIPVVTSSVTQLESFLPKFTAREGDDGNIFVSGKSRYKIPEAELSTFFTLLEKERRNGNSLIFAEKQDEKSSGIVIEVDNFYRPEITEAKIDDHLLRDCASILMEAVEEIFDLAPLKQVAKKIPIAITKRDKPVKRDCKDGSTIMSERFHILIPSIKISRPAKHFLINRMIKLGTFEKRVYEAVSSYLVSEKYACIDEGSRYDPVYFVGCKRDPKEHAYQLSAVYDYYFGSDAAPSSLAENKDINNDNQSCNVVGELSINYEMSEKMGGLVKKVDIMPNAKYAAEIDSYKVKNPSKSSVGLPGLPALPTFELIPMTNDGSVVRVAFATKTGNYHDLPFDQVFANLTSGKNHMYEVLTGSVIPYFDYDQKEIKTAEELNTVQMDFWADLCANVQKVFPKAELNKNFFVMFSSGASAKYGPFKFSAHIVVREHGYYACGEAIKRALCDKMDAVLKFKCDRSVYKEFGKDQKMRMMYCYKRINENGSSPDDDPNRVLIPACCENITPELYKRTIIQNTAGEEYIYVQLEEAKSGRSIMSEVKQSMIEDEQAIKEGYIEYTGQSDDECMDAMNALFDSWHPSSKTAGVPKLQKEGFYVMSYKNTTADACKICGRAHADNNTYMTYHPEQHVGYYKCHSVNKDGNKEQKIKILGKKDKPAISKQFDRDDSYCWYNFSKYYKTKVFASFDQLLEEAKKDVPRVLTKIESGNGFYIKKTNTGDRLMEQIEKLDKLDFPISYIEIDKKSKQPVEERINFSKFYFNFQKYFSSFAEVVCKPNSTVSEEQFNTWAGFKARKVETVDMNKINPILDFIKEIYANNDETLFNFIMMWMSFMVCCPEVAAGVTLVLIGPQGIGKNVIFDFISEHVIGDYLTVAHLGIEPFVHNFNSDLAGKRLLVVLEVASSKEEFRSNFDKLKGLITERRISIEVKNGARYMIDNIGCWVLGTNHKDSVIAEVGDRRHCFLEVNPKYKDNIDFFDYFRNQILTQDAGDHFFTYLLSLCAQKKDILKVPLTDLKQQVIELSKPNYLRFLSTVKEDLCTLVDDEGKKFKDNFATEHDNRFMWSTDEIPSLTLYNKYITWCETNGERNKATETKFGSMIKEYIDKKRKASGYVYILSSLRV